MRWDDDDEWSELERNKLYQMFGHCSMKFIYDCRGAGEKLLGKEMRHIDNLLDVVLGMGGVLDG